MDDFNEYKELSENEKLLVTKTIQDFLENLYKYDMHIDVRKIGMKEFTTRMLNDLEVKPWVAFIDVNLEKIIQRKNRMFEC